jgi:hypothetical protein
MKRWILLVPLAALALTAGCGDKRPPLKQPSADSFKTGTCRDAADAVLALGKFAYDNDGKKSLTVADRDKLRDQANKLIVLRSAAEAPLDQQLQDLITAVGFVRLRVEPTYDPQLLKDMGAAQNTVQKTCTT